MRRSSFNQTRATREKCVLDGIKFGSGLERDRYIVLRDMQRKGAISKLQCHPKFTFLVHDVKIGDYTPDFSYLDSRERVHIEDVKGFKRTKAGKWKPRYNREFPWQKNLMLACFGLEVEIV